MAGPKATTSDETPVPGSLGGAAPSSEEMCRVVAAWAAGQRKNGVECEVILWHLDGSGRRLSDKVSVPLDPPVADELPDRIVAVLAKLAPGQWLGGKALAAEAGVDDPGSGYFRRVVGSLKSAGKIESNQNLGYRLIRT